MSRTEAKRWQSRIERLQRRADWLKDRHEADPRNLTRDKAEESALRWAIPILREWVEFQSATQVPDEA